ncbi:hypothetical protein IWX88_000194 [Frigoribacterium sp. CG_9.8]|nr:hypothetical protein [Frigoribacterium sp. CG_9.8]
MPTPNMQNRRPNPKSSKPAKRATQARNQARTLKYQPTTKNR